MSDKNIDKDIEIIEDTTVDIEVYNEVLKENIILNAELDETIKELNEKDISISMFKNEVKIYKKANDNLLVKNAELRVELETYKKIAEKLAKTIEDEYIVDYCRKSDCKDDYCLKFDGKCYECIIDCARKEVEK